MPGKTALFRFYEELNDFLPIIKRKVAFPFNFQGRRSIKDAMEALGIPHTEVDLILVNGESVSFKYILKEGDQVSVYPVFESIDISPVVRLQKRPLRKTRFILDVHLGKLARYLRMLGFDSLYERNYDDPEIIFIAATEKRIILTRDLGILKSDRVRHGYWLRSKDSKEQLMEVMNRFQLHNKINPFTRCINCNGKLRKVSRRGVLTSLEPRTKLYYTQFFRCQSCSKVFWEGSHYERMKVFVDRIKEGVTK